MQRTVRAPPMDHRPARRTPSCSPDEPLSAPTGRLGLAPWARASGSRKLDWTVPLRYLYNRTSITVPLYNGTSSHPRPSEWPRCAHRGPQRAPLLGSAGPLARRMPGPAAVTTEARTLPPGAPQRDVLKSPVTTSRLPPTRAVSCRGGPPPEISGGCFESLIGRYLYGTSITVPL